MITDRVIPAILIAIPLLLSGVPAGAQSERQPADPAPAAEPPAPAGADAAQQETGAARGPIVGGRYRQPTQAEIDARLRRPEQPARGGGKQNKDLDDLYNEALRLSSPKR